MTTFLSGEDYLRRFHILTVEIVPQDSLWFLYDIKTTACTTQSPYKDYVMGQYILRDIWK